MALTKSPLLEKRVTKLEVTVDGIAKRQTSILEKIHDMSANLKDTVAAAISSQFDKIDEKLEQRILAEFEKKELDEYRKREMSSDDYKRHATKAVIQWVVVGVLGIIASIVIASLIATNNNQEEVVSDYYDEIVKLQEQVEELKANK